MIMQVSLTSIIFAAFQIAMTVYLSDSFEVLVEGMDATSIIVN